MTQNHQRQYRYCGNTFRWARSTCGFRISLSTLTLRRIVQHHDGWHTAVCVLVHSMVQRSLSCDPTYEMWPPKQAPKYPALRKFALRWPKICFTIMQKSSSLTAEKKTERDGEASQSAMDPQCSGRSKVTSK